MGLDIQTCVDNLEDVFSRDYRSDPELDSFHQHSLSRTFCWLVCAKDSNESQFDLDEIGRIAGVDVTALNSMREYTTELAANEAAEYARSAAERAQILTQARIDRERLEGNIDRVIDTVEELIAALALIHDLPRRLVGKSGRIDVADYFGDFEQDKGDGYIGNNLGRDLRNLRRFLLYAKVRGTKTVYFEFG